LEDAKGLPEDGLLSIKVGNTKRQAPASKIGQPFRFATSLADPSPIKVEVFVPAAPAQTVTLDPGAETFQVSFGDMQVTFAQHAVEELERPPVDIQAAAEAKGLPSEKLHAATQAANYLEEHNLVKMFQDILHGLLTAKPEDPYSYVEERFARAKKLAAKKADTAGASDSPSTRKKSLGLSKVETLLQMVQRTRDNLPLVVNLLPTDLKNSLESPEFIASCQEEFKRLDTKGTGTLEAKDLAPVVVSLTSAKDVAVDEKHCKKFLKWFDVNMDGNIDQAEFVALVQFCWVGHFLESEEGKQVVEFAQVEENSFSDFIKMIEVDVERLWSIIPFLPEWLSEHVTSDEFQASCIENFKSLDKDGSGTLEPHELYPVIESLCEAHPMTISYEKCGQFASLFDSAGNGVITLEEFIEFAQFLLVMNFLSNSEEGREVEKKAELAQTVSRTRTVIDSIVGNPAAVPEVYGKLPGAIVAQVTADSFGAACGAPFAQAERLPLAGLYDVILELTGINAFSVTAEQYALYIASCGKEDASKAEFEAFARYAVVMGYLEYCQENQDMLQAEVLLGEERIQQLLEGLRTSFDQVGEVAPYLPDALVEYLQSETFAEKCMEDFQSLDADGSGSLEPCELFPVILQLAEAHHYSLTQEHCRHFVDIFDDKRNGVITRAEFLNFARFMMIMGFMQTEEGQLVVNQVELVQASEGVEEFLATLEKDREAVHKVIPLLPKEVYSEITSDAFSLSCHERFMELDKAGAGVLKPEQLYEVVADLSSVIPGAVTQEQCERFTSIFDIHQNGVLCMDEFLDFTRFLCVMSYLHSEEGKEKCTNALAIMEDSKRVDDLVTMSSDRSQVHKPAPALDPSIGAAAGSDRANPRDSEELPDTEVQLYKDRAARLSEENAALKSRMERMESLMQRMEGRMEEQDQRLRQTEVDLATRS